MRQSRKENKNRFSKAKERRFTGSREPYQNILIVCEGKETERKYFYFEGFRQDLRAATVDLKVVGAGMNTASLVEETIKLKSKNDYEQVWSVFDKDSFPSESVNRAFQLAADNDIRIAFSNECFELWYVLHFEYLESALNRKQLAERVKELFKEYFPEKYPSSGPKRNQRCYDKADKGIYDLLKKYQQTALFNAENLLPRNAAKTPSDNPSTGVYLLVEELNKLSREN